MALSNILEAVVRQKLDDLIEHTDCCRCEKCYQDIMAIALNMCQPKYVNTHEGELLVKIRSTEQQSNIDVEIAILRAIEIVKSHPHHD